MTGKNRWKCMIVDDEPIAIRIIRQHLSKMTHYEVVHTSSNARETSDFLSSHDVDLLFLDIEMPELNGLQLYKTLKNPPDLILVTAHREYAVEGFEINAVDYLMKPISFPRLAQALDRFEQSRLLADDISRDKGDYYIYVTVDRIKKKILLDDIIYVESLKDYIQIVTTGEKIITRETTADFEQRLPAGSFLRIHRSFIINMKKVDTVSHHEISIGPYALPVGRSYKNEAMETLGVR